MDLHMLCISLFKTHEVASLACVAVLFFVAMCSLLGLLSERLLLDDVVVVFLLLVCLIFPSQA